MSNMDLFVAHAERTNAENRRKAAERARTTIIANVQPSKAVDVAKPGLILPSAARPPLPPARAKTPGESHVLRDRNGGIVPPGSPPEEDGDPAEWSALVDEFVDYGSAWYGSGHGGTPRVYSPPKRPSDAGLVPYGHMEPWSPTPLMSEMGDNLWQGGVRYGVELPKEIGFRHVLNMTGSYSYKGVDKIDSYINVPTSDTTRPGAFDFDIVDELADWVNKRRETGPVLVHCAAGLNRSGIVVARTIMKDEGISANGTIEAMRKQRVNWVLSNRVFEAWLRTFDFDADEMFQKGASLWTGK